MGGAGRPERRDGKASKHKPTDGGTDLACPDKHGVKQGEGAVVEQPVLGKGEGKRHGAQGKAPPGNPTFLHQAPPPVIPQRHKGPWSHGTAPGPKHEPDHIT